MPRERLCQRGPDRFSGREDALESAHNFKKVGGGEKRGKHLRFFWEKVGKAVKH